MEPVDLEHDTGRNVLTITWDDGGRSVLAMPYLRAWCPCAGCQGHGTTMRFLEEDPSIAATHIEEVGAYALRFRFSDGHDAGIYRWTWFWAISAESEPAGLKHGMFDSGRYFPA